MGLEHSRANCFLTSYLHFSTNLLLGLKDRKVLENKEKLPHECAPFYDRAYGANWYRQLRFDKTDWNTEEQDTCSNLCCLSYIADCEKEGSSVGCPSNDALLAMTYTAMERSKTRWEMPRTNNLIKFSFSYHRQLAKPCLIVAYMLRYSFVHAPITWLWSREERAPTPPTYLLVGPSKKEPLHWLGWDNSVSTSIIEDRLVGRMIWMVRIRTPN